MKEASGKNPEQEIAFYEVTGYFCPQVPLKRCDQVVQLENRVVVVQVAASEMDEYSKAFQIAAKDPPSCPVHFTKMIPQLSKFEVE